MSDAEQLNDDAYEQENAAQEDVTPAGETGAEAPQVQETGSAQSATDLELFEKYIEEDLDFDLPNRGDMREGMIVEVRPSELLVNVGSKRDGVVPQSDLARLDPDYVKSLHEGQTVDVVVSRQPDDDGIFLLSIAEALQQRDWLLAEQLLESSEVTSHRVVGYNKGGLTVEFNHLRGFVPASHVVDMPRNLSEEQRRAELESRIGKTLRLKVIEVERRRRRLVMSQSLAEREFQAARREELFKTISVGDVIQGEVRSMRPFGAFVDIGGADGLLHVSEIDWRPVNHPRDVLEVGEMIEVEVIRVDPENQRIAPAMAPPAQPVGYGRAALPSGRNCAGEDHARGRLRRLCPVGAGRGRVDPHQRVGRHRRGGTAQDGADWRRGICQNSARRQQPPAHRP